MDENKNPFKISQPQMRGGGGGEIALLPIFMFWRWVIYQFAK